MRHCTILSVQLFNDGKNGKGCTAQLILNLELVDVKFRLIVWDGISDDAISRELGTHR